MSKSYYSLGLMSGTSMDGVDASVIKTDGKSRFKAILDKYFEYPQPIYKYLTKLRDKIKSSRDIKKFSKEIENVEREITLFHVKAINQILKTTKVNINFIGFHGQTIYHNAKEKISKQLGDGKLLSKITKKTVIYDFRQNDLKNGGEGAPLAPIFHKLLVEQKKISLPVIIVNIGGISNYTIIWRSKELRENFLISKDTGPGNCLIDQWIKKKSNNLYYDKDGKIGKLGKINRKIVDQALEATTVKSSYDLKDFNLSLFKKLSLEDGAASLAEFTADTLIGSLYDFLNDAKWYKKINVLVCGGGRKNNFLIARIKKKTSNSVKLIDDYNVDGDFVESQAFGYLAVRSYLKLPITFPETTGCIKPTTGGKIIKSK